MAWPGNCMFRKLYGQENAWPGNCMARKLHGQEIVCSGKCGQEIVAFRKWLEIESSLALCIYEIYGKNAIFPKKLKWPWDDLGMTLKQEKIVPHPICTIYWSYMKALAKTKKTSPRSTLYDDFPRNESYLNILRQGQLKLL